MSILDDMFNVGMMGEPERLDHVIHENQKLQARVSQLIELLVAKGLITTQERAAFEDVKGGATESDPERLPEGHP